MSTIVIVESCIESCIYDVWVYGFIVGFVVVEVKLCCGDICTLLVCAVDIALWAALSNTLTKMKYRHVFMLLSRLSPKVYKAWAG